MTLIFKMEADHLKFFLRTIRGPLAVSLKIFALNYYYYYYYSFLSSSPLLLFSCSGGVKITHSSYQEASPLSYSSLLWFQNLPFCFGNCWSPRSCSVYQRFCIFNVCSSCKNCPSARCASAANVVCRDVDVFGARNIFLRHFL
jgi:hypothetical protein